MYEANPLTFVMKKAGGSGTNGNENMIKTLAEVLSLKEDYFRIQISNSKKNKRRSHDAKNVGYSMGNQGFYKSFARSHFRHEFISSFSFKTR